MDNFYNSVKLAQFLRRTGFGLVGTLRKNRGIPKSLGHVTDTLKTGKITYKRHGNILDQAWKGKRVVNMISTIHSAQMTEVQSKRPSSAPTMKPVCIVDYNKYMHGVDIVDQHMSYYPFMRKSVKWMKVFLYLRLCAACNSHAMYKLYNKNVTLLDFLQNIVEDLIAKGSELPEPDNEENLATNPSPPKIAKKAPKFDLINRIDGQMNRHKLINIPSTSKKERLSRNCKVCKKKKIRSSTKFICSACNVPLHPEDCFTRYHTLKYRVSKSRRVPLP